MVQPEQYTKAARASALIGFGGLAGFGVFGLLALCPIFTLLVAHMFFILTLTFAGLAGLMLLGAAGLEVKSRKTAHALDTGEFTCSSTDYVILGSSDSIYDIKLRFTKNITGNGKTVFIGTPPPSPRETVDSHGVTWTKISI